MEYFLYLLLAIGCSGAIALIFKLSESKGLNRYVITTFNYVMAVIISFNMLPHKKLYDSSWASAFLEEARDVFLGGGVFSQEASGFWAIVLGLITGIIYFLSFYLYQYNVNKNSASLSATFMKLGILIPTVLSMLIFREVPTGYQMMGIILAVIGIILINLAHGEFGKKVIRLDLILLFLIGGLGDFNSKLFQQFSHIGYNELFVFYIFLSALIFSLVVLLIKRVKIKPLDIGFGLLVGIPNQLTSYFLLYSLEGLKASLVFPIFSTGTILFVSMISVIVLKEKLKRIQYWGLATILLALLFLNM